MSVTASDGGIIRLEGVCPIEDAEALLRRLCEDEAAVIDWSGCEQAHTAVIQVLLAAGAKVVGRPTDPFLRRHIGPTIGAP